MRLRLIDRLAVKTLAFSLRQRKEREREHPTRYEAPLFFCTPTISIWLRFSRYSSLSSGSIRRCCTYAHASVNTLSGTSNSHALSIQRGRYFKYQVWARGPIISAICFELLRGHVSRFPRSLDFRAPTDRYHRKVEG